jgi:coenzyme F420-0:L-glutamate ligase/coenzyme F420-1:gamma-L-glutamate ligase
VSDLVLAAPPRGVTVHPVPGLPEFAPGDDLAAALAAAAPWLADGDVVVVTSKVVSKVEGSMVLLVPGADREEARQQAIATETVRVVARRGPLTIGETRHGWVVAAAGIDASNVRSDALLLLPADADASAAALRVGLRAALGIEVGVVVSDTFGRTWRDGLTDVAIGAAGIGSLVDHRGAVDVHGNQLATTQVALVDELAAAADLVKGKLAGVPVAVVRGLPLVPDPGESGTRPLVRLGAEDLFPLATRDVVAGRRAADIQRPAPGAPAALAAALAVAAAALPEFPATVDWTEDPDGALGIRMADCGGPAAALDVGAVLGVALVQLHTEGWRTRWEPSPGPGVGGRLWLVR